MQYIKLMNEPLIYDSAINGETTETSLYPIALQRPKFYSWHNQHYNFNNLLTL